MSPTCLESTACPLPCLGRLRLPDISGVDCMSSTVLGLTRCPLHSLSRLLVLYLPWVDSVSPTFVQSTACPGPLLGCLQVDTFLRRLCVDYHFLCLHPVNYLSSRRLHLSYTWKPRAPRKSQVLCNLEQCVYRPSSY